MQDSHDDIAGKEWSFGSYILLSKNIQIIGVKERSAMKCCCFVVWYIHNLLEFSQLVL